MKRKIISLILVLTMVLSLLPATTIFTSAEVTSDTGWYTNAAEGVGSSEDAPYIIKNTAQLEGLASLVNADTSFYEKFIKLDNDFDGSDALKTPIGTEECPFNGTFDGNGKTVKLNISVSGKAYCAGLFGCVGGEDEFGTIKNVSTEGVVMASNDNEDSGYNYAGGVVGYNSNGCVTNCSSKAKVTVAGSSDHIAGGVVGYNDTGAVENCYSEGDVLAGGSDYADVGGVVGTNWDTVINCYAAGAVKANGTGAVDKLICAGGVIGTNWDTVINCYATGDVTAKDDSTDISDDLICSGGVVGCNEDTVTNCYAGGVVNVSDESIGDGSVHDGGVVGYNNDGTVTNCYSAAQSYNAEGEEASITEKQMKAKPGEECALVDKLNTYARGDEGKAAGCIPFTVVEKENDGYPQLASYIATVEGAYFYFIDDAIKAAESTTPEDAKTVTLIANVYNAANNTQLAATEGNYVKFDFNGYNIFFSDSTKKGVLSEDGSTITKVDRINKVTDAVKSVVFEDNNMTEADAKMIIGYYYPITAPKNSVFIFADSVNPGECCYIKYADAGAEPDVDDASYEEIMKFKCDKYVIGDISMTEPITVTMTISGDSTAKLSDVKTYKVEFDGKRPCGSKVVWEVTGCSYKYVGDHIGTDSVTIICEDVGNLHISATLVDSFGKPVTATDGKIVAAETNVKVNAQFGTIINTIVTLVKTVVKIIFKLFGR